MIVVVAVLIIFTVGLVVFLIVTNQIAQREAVVATDEIDARNRRPSALLIKIGATSQAIRQLADASFVTTPEATHRVTIFAVPFRPWRRKTAKLIPTIGDIPGVGD